MATVSPGSTSRLNSLRKWYARKVNKPYVLPNVDRVFINVYGNKLERGLHTVGDWNGSAYDTKESQDLAVDQIADFYGKVATPGDLLTVPGTTQLDLTCHDVYFPARKLSNPILQYSISKDIIFKGLKSLSGLVVSNKTEPIEVYRIDKFKSQLRTAFKIYQQQLRLFNGSVSPPLNFVALADRVDRFFENLSAFIEFNGYQMKDFESINIGFNVQFDVTGVSLVTSDTRYINLRKGKKYYFSTLNAGNNSLVNEMISQFSDIIDRRSSQLNWTQFIHAHMKESGIRIDYCGKPQTETVKSVIQKFEADAELGPLGTTAAANAAIKAALENPKNAQQAFDEANKYIDKQNKSLQTRLKEITDAIQNVTDEINKVSEFLNKYRIDALIEAALECVLFKGGFAGGSIPEWIPGLDPFALQPPKIDIRFPKIEFKLPIIAINKELQAEIEAGLKAAAMQAVFGAIEAIADIIKQLCMLEPTDEEGSSPVPDILGAFASPLEIAKSPTGDVAGDCYTDFGLPRSPTELFLTDLSPLISSRELCNLFRGVASPEVLQVISNLLDTAPAFAEVQQQLADESTIEQFFMCLGNLVDPKYCQGVYDAASPTLPSIDPCDIEDNFQDILDLLDEIRDISRRKPPSMLCGAGIVPALANVASYNHAVTSLIDSVFQPVQQAFLQDLGNFKETIITVDPYNESNEQVENQLRHLNVSLRHLEQNADEVPDEAKTFFNNLIPSQLTETFGDVRNAVEGLTNMAQNDILTNIGRLQSRLTYAVAAQAKNLYENIEDNFETSELFDHNLDAASWNDQQEAPRYYSFLTTIKQPLHSSFDAHEKTLSYGINGAQRRDDLKIYTNRLGHGYSPNPNTDLTISAGTKANQRRGDAITFANQILSQARAALGNNPPSDDEMSALFVVKNYPYAYFSLLNMFAYQISQSPLFDVENMRNLSLFPKFCGDTGDVSNVDLLDINKIKQEAMQEFADNSCLDREYELGPVRDAAILALVNGYIQVLAVDLLLKNIFVIDEFGSEFLADAPSLLNELFSQSSQRIVQNSVVSFMVDNIPPIVMKGACIPVKKFIDRDPTNFAYAVSGRPPELEQFLDNNAADIADIPIEDNALQQVAFRYLFEKRFMNSRAIIAKFFEVPGDTVLENFMISGIPYVDMPDFNSRTFDHYPVKVHSGVKPPYNTTTYMLTSAQNSADGLIDDDLTPMRNYFAYLNYVSPGASLMDEYITKDLGPGSEGGLQADGSSAAIRAEREMESLLKYGATVVERAVEVEINTTVLEDGISEMIGDTLGDNVLAQLFAPMMLELSHFIDELVPISTTTNDDGETIERYLMGFETFRDVYQPFAAFANLATLGTGAAAALPLPFYLCGRGPTIYDDTQEYNSPAFESLLLVGGGGGWDNSDRLKLTDYDLIRSWVVYLQEGKAGMGSFSPDFLVGGWCPIAGALGVSAVRSALKYNGGRAYEGAQNIDIEPRPTIYPYKSTGNNEAYTLKSTPVYTFRAKSSTTYGWNFETIYEPLGDSQRPNIPVMRAEILRGILDDSSAEGRQPLFTKNAALEINTFNIDLETPEFGMGSMGFLGQGISSARVLEPGLGTDSATGGNYNQGDLGDQIAYHARGRDEYQSFAFIFSTLMGVDIGDFHAGVAQDFSDPLPSQYRDLWARMEAVLAPYVGEIWEGDGLGSEMPNASVLSDAIDALSRWAGFVPEFSPVDGENLWNTSEFGAGRRNGRPYGTLAHAILWNADGDISSVWPTAFRELIRPAAAFAAANRGPDDDDGSWDGEYIYGEHPVLEPFVFYESQSFQVVGRVDYLRLKYRFDNDDDDDDNDDTGDWEYRISYDINLYLVNKTPLLNVSTGRAFVPDSAGEGGALAGGLYSFLDFYDGTNLELGRSNRNLMMEVFREYRSEAELLVAAQQVSDALTPQPDPNPLIKEKQESEVQKLMKRIFPTMEMELRLAYLTPETSQSSHEGQTMFKFMGNNETAVNAYKSYFPYQTGGDRFFAHIATDKKSEIDIRDQMFSEEFANFLQYNATETGFERFLLALYSNNRIAMAKQLATVSSDIFGAYQPVDVARILQYLYLAGEIQNWFHIFKNKDVFTDTKAILVLALQAAFAGDDYAATSNCDVSALQNTAMNGLQGAMTPFANMGQSFMNKMLKETPKHILKGVCELTEPHVIISKQVRDISKQVFDGIAMGERMANSAADMADAMRVMAEGGAPAGCADNATAGSFEMPPVPRIPMTMAQALAHIQGQIDSNYPREMPDFMKPQVSAERGIELEGSLPLVAMVPPITPFGIIYLLLQLMDFPINEIQMATDDDGCNDNDS